MKSFNCVWVFQGNNAGFPSATFSSREKAMDWIDINKVSGILTEYPLDISVYDWAISKKYFNPNTDEKKTPDFISKFSSAYLNHHHFKDGIQQA